MDIPPDILAVMCEAQLDPALKAKGFTPEINPVRQQVIERMLQAAAAHGWRLTPRCPVTDDEFRQFTHALLGRMAAAAPSLYPVTNKLMTNQAVSDAEYQAAHAALMRILQEMLAP